MQCVTPMIRGYHDIPLKQKMKDKELGIKRPQKIISRQEVQDMMKGTGLEYWLNNKVAKPNLLKAIEKWNKEEEKKGTDWRYQIIGCGNCYACQLNKSAKWATRIMNEASEHEQNWFITLTYDEENIPIPKSSDYEGEHFENDGTWSGSLDPKDMDKFIHDLRQDQERRLNNKGIKYYYCGEYGSETLRPHYHLILMGAQLDLNQLYDCHIDPKWHKAKWKSKEIEKFWPYGMIDIAELEWSEAAYTARYTMKKFRNNMSKRELYSIGKLPEYVRMSRRPGIGKNYYNKNKEEIYKNDEMIMRTVKGNVGSVKPPYDRWMQNEHPEWYEIIKEDRKKAKERADSLKSEINNYTDLEKLEMAAKNVETKAKQLPRGDM